MKSTYSYNKRRTSTSKFDYGEVLIQSLNYLQWISNFRWLGYCVPTQHVSAHDSSVHVRHRDIKYCANALPRTNHIINHYACTPRTIWMHQQAGLHGRSSQTMLLHRVSLDNCHLQVSTLLSSDCSSRAFQLSFICSKESYQLKYTCRKHVHSYCINGIPFLKHASKTACKQVSYACFREHSF